MYILIEKNNGVFNGFEFKNENDNDVLPNFTPFEKACSNLGSGRFIVSGFRGTFDYNEMKKQGIQWEKDIERLSGVRMKLTVVNVTWLTENWGVWERNIPEV